MKFTANAISSGKGFYVELYYKNLPEIIAHGKTKNYPHDNYKDGTEVVYVNFLALLALIPLFIFSPMEKLSLIAWSIIMLLPLRPLMGMVVATKKMWQWHGLEHKLVSLYYEDKNRTKENILSAPSVDPKCGTRIEVLKFILLMFLLVIYIVSFFTNTTLLPIILILLIIYICIYRNTEISDYNHPIFLKMSMWIQRHITTKEPEDWQIEQALELAQKLDAELMKLGYII